MVILFGAMFLGIFLIIVAIGEHAHFGVTTIVLLSVFGSVLALPGLIVTLMAGLSGKSSEKVEIEAEHEKDIHEINKQCEEYYSHLPQWGRHQSGMSTTKFVKMVGLESKRDEVTKVLDGWSVAGRARKRMTGRGWRWWKTKMEN